jgi:hypothetical protein
MGVLDIDARLVMRGSWGCKRKLGGVVEWEIQ